MARAHRILESLEKGRTDTFGSFSLPEFSTETRPGLTKGISFREVNVSEPEDLEKLSDMKLHEFSNGKEISSVIHAGKVRDSRLKQARGSIKKDIRNP